MGDNSWESREESAAGNKTTSVRGACHVLASRGCDCDDEAHEGDNQGAADELSATLELVGEMGNANGQNTSSHVRWDCHQLCCAVCVALQHWLDDIFDALAFANTYKSRDDGWQTKHETVG